MHSYPLIRLPLTILALFLMMTYCQGQDYSSFTCPVIIDGNELKFPFTGGFDSPQFSHCDFNMDGVKDLFVFDRRGSVPMIFERTGTGLSEGYTFTREHKGSLPDSLVQWAFMKDFNRDGEYELFCAPTYLGYSGIQLYQSSLNQDGQWSFQYRQMGPGIKDLVNFRNPNGVDTNITVPFTDIADIVDVDFDGDLDVLSFDLGGSYIAYYRNLQEDKNLSLDTMDFILEDRCFGKIKEAGLDASLFLSNNPNDCAVGLKDEAEPDLKSGGAHAGSTIMAFDEDDDGDLELYLGDLNTTTLVVGRNGGNAQANWITSSNDSFPTYDQFSDLPYFSSAFRVDVDGDGLDDMVSSVNNLTASQNVDNTWLYLNTGNNSSRFDFEQKNFLADETIDLGSYSAPVFVDENADGLMDIIVGSGGYFSVTQSPPDMVLQLFRNTGTATSPRFELVDKDYLKLSTYTSTGAFRPVPAAGDLDGDGDDDIIIAVFDGFLLYFENIAGPGQQMVFGNPKFGTSDQPGFQGIRGNKLGKPTIHDVNKDGLGDIIIGQEFLKANFQDPNNNYFGSVSYYENIGSVGNPVFESDINKAPNNAALGRMNSQKFLSTNSSVLSAPEFVEVDGELQVLIGSKDGWIKRYGFDEDDYSTKFPLLDSIVGGIDEGTRSTLTTADIDNDGYLELLMGNIRGGLSFFNTDLMSTDSSVAMMPHVNRLDLFPNPAGNSITITHSENLEIQTFTVMSVDGRIVSSSSYIDNQIDISKLMSGIYLLRFETSAGQMVKRLVKI